MTEQEKTSEAIGEQENAGPLLTLPRSIFDLKAVECKGNFRFEMVDRIGSKYRMAWVCRPHDATKLAESCPSLAKALQGHEQSVHELLQAKLKAFGLEHLDKYLVQSDCPITKLTRGLNGDLNTLNTDDEFFEDSRADYYSEWKNGFEIELPWFDVSSDVYSAQRIYEAIAESKAARDTDPAVWRFQWADLPGDPKPEFVVGERVDQETGAVCLVGRERLEAICKREYPGLKDSILSKWLMPFVDAAQKQVIVRLQFGERAGEQIYLELDPEVYFPIKPHKWYGYDGKAADSRFNYD